LKTFAALLLVLGTVSLGWAGGSLSEQEQLRIIEDYMLVTGQVPPGSSALGYSHDDSLPSPPVKCGTPAILEFVTNYERLDRDLLKSLGVQVLGRPTMLTDSVDSPQGLFRVHYTTIGFDALSGGVATAVKVADIMDSVYAHIVDTLGYPPPPQDGYEPGGDEKYDVYMLNLGRVYYGQTFTDSLGYPTPRQATSFIELNARPEQLHGYENQPMDAIRVTAAHELFHAVQFGVDWREAEDTGSSFERRYWMEMSAVWMEEEIYDDINDYYTYLEYFFNVPEWSLQQFAGTSDLHPYASCVFPIYLSERFGRDIVRDIWLLCGQLGIGPSFLRAADSAIWETSGHTQNWVTAMSEFALWNYLTGERADLTVWDGFDNQLVPGYSEKEAYPPIPYEKLHAYYQYPVVVESHTNEQQSPRHNGAYYLSLFELASASVVHDTTTWVCDTGAGEFPNCSDSFQVRDTLGWGPPWHSYTVHVDTFFNVYLGLGGGKWGSPTLPWGWGVNIIYQFEEALDSLIVDRFVAPDRATLKIDLLDHTQYQSLTFILTPASADRSYYENFVRRIRLVGYRIGENSYDSTKINLPAALLDPYPNPVVVAEMDRPRVTFRLRVPTDETSFPIYGFPFTEDDPYLQVDVYTIAGERVKSVDNITWRETRDGVFFTEWDLTNESGDEVAAGVYLVYGKLLSRAKRGVVLLEDRTKVVVIR